MPLGPVYVLELSEPRCFVSSPSFLDEPRYGVLRLRLNLEPSSEIDVLLGAPAFCTGRPLGADAPPAPIALGGASCGADHE